MYDSLSRANRLLNLKKRRVTKIQVNEKKEKLGVQIDLVWEDTLFNWNMLQTHIVMLKHREEVC